MRELFPSYGGRTVAITGASGYIGSALAAAAGRTGARLLLISRRPPGTSGAVEETAGAEQYVADVCERDVWNEIARRADVVFHLAGNTNHTLAVQRPAEALASLVLPIIHLHAAARVASRSPRVVHASTVRVYGDVRALPVAEDSGARPVTPWGVHNLITEQHLRRAFDEGALDGVSLRLSNVYGESPGGGAVGERSAVNRIVALAAAGADLPLWGDGDYLRDFVHLDDVVRAFLAAGATEGIGGRAFNVATGSGITVRALYELIAERAAAVTGTPVRVRSVPWPDEETQIECRDFTADIRRFSEACGWSPSVPLRSGLDRLLARKAARA